MVDICTSVHLNKQFKWLFQQTTSFFLKIATYHTLANPEIYAKLKAELREAMPDPAITLPLATLEKLPYLHGVVQEAHRFSHGVVGRLQRISPGEPLQYQDWVIPAGTSSLDDVSSSA